MSELGTTPLPKPKRYRIFPIRVRGEQLEQLEAIAIAKGLSCEVVIRLAIDKLVGKE